MSTWRNGQSAKPLRCDARDCDAPTRPRAEPSRAEPSRAEPSRAEPSRATLHMACCCESKDSHHASAQAFTLRRSEARCQHPVVLGGTGGRYCQSTLRDTQGVLPWYARGAAMGSAPQAHATDTGLRCAGDALYIPENWWHHVRSRKRNISVNLDIQLFTHMQVGTLSVLCRM